MSVRPKDADEFSRGGAPWWLAPVAAAATTVGGSILQYKLSKKNTDTAHQREVADLKKAGLNPVLSAMGGRGASDPVSPDFGETVGKGVANALALAQMRANVDLTRAQAFETQARGSGLAIDNATRAGTQEHDINVARLKSRLAELDVEQRERLLDTAVAKAKAELAQTEASAKSLKARAQLDELARVGAKNIADLEAKLGAGSPAALLILKYLSVLMR